MNAIDPPADAERYERKEAWVDAYRHTPQGKPVELRIRSGRGD